MIVIRISALEVRAREELPYRWGRRGDSAAARLAHRLGATTHRCDPLIDPVAKARRVACYASQLPHLDPACDPTI